MMFPSLSRIWTEVLASDPGAWESLVRQFNGLVIAVARAHGLAEADLEDCAQQTWIALYAGREQIKDPLKIPAWLVKVARRKAARIQLRAKSARSTEALFEPMSSGRSPEELYLEAIESARLQTALEMLDPRCRMLLARLFLSHDSESYRQIAEDMGLAPNSIGAIRSRCLARLRQLLEEIDSEPY